MNFFKITLFLFFQLLTLPSFSSGGDSLLYINNVKQFAFKITEFTSENEFYTMWSQQEKPFLYVYASYPDSVKKPKSLVEPYIFCKTDEIKAAKIESELKGKGYHTFYYKTYANSNALLNKQLISYSDDAVAFIVFHELIHNYLTEKKIKIPYEFNEALCDVIGNYGALEFALSNKNADSIIFKNQIITNERIYESMNEAISQINKNPKKVSKINKRCNKIINELLTHSNSFQKDRFNYKVNNAYLLKNEYYCKHYFLLKKVLLKQKSISGLLEIIKGVPEDSSECEKYLMKFI